MVDLSFQVDSAEPVTHAVAPTLAFKLRISQRGQTPIHAVALRCQVRIDAARRSYNTGEQDALRDLFDTPDRWGQTFRGMLCTHTSVVVPPFAAETVVDLPVPCSFDFNLAATKYFYALEGGAVPLALFFSGTAFYEAEDGRLQVAQIPWEKEAAFRLPVRVWQDMMEHYYPNGAWLCLRQDAFDRLYEYKRRHGLPSWEQALDDLLATAETRCTP
jgi:Family of unknown function (DUF6084)